jgi:hypothetical protein
MALVSLHSRLHLSLVTQRLFGTVLTSSPNLCVNAVPGEIDALLRTEQIFLGVYGIS